MKFRVLRQHEGDRFYAEGDEREADETDVAHLVAAGVLAKATDESVKAEPKPKNKAEPALKNKAGK